ncbi:MAG: hypothetical protein LAP87_05960 [Acidobacteriia bacterium]|nr:hypothetical protein [Terriglobia bacterium]
MYTLIEYSTGTIVEAVVLSRQENRMRVVVAGSADALGLRRLGRQWVTESGEPVEFGFLMSGGLVKESTDSHVQPLTARIAG